MQAKNTYSWFPPFYAVFVQKILSDLQDVIPVSAFSESTWSPQDNHIQIGSLEQKAIRNWVSIDGFLPIKLLGLFLLKQYDRTFNFSKLKIDKRLLTGSCNLSWTVGCFLFSSWLQRWMCIIEGLKVCAYFMRFCFLVMLAFSWIIMQAMRKGNGCQFY